MVRKALRGDDEIGTTENPIHVIGLGYVGFPLAKALSSVFEVVGIDNDKDYVERLNYVERLKSHVRDFKIVHTDDFKSDIKIAIICLPTPVDDKTKSPDLRCLFECCEFLKNKISKEVKPLIIFESTYQPGMSRYLASLIGNPDDICLGYSPERINPGDEVNTLENVTKVVSAQDVETLSLVIFIYRKICKNLHIAPSIEVAEMSKLVENIQRDVNIALMNDLAITCHASGLNFKSVLEACRTKWNFSVFVPGFVGGHCIPVDTYYYLDFNDAVYREVPSRLRSHEIHKDTVVSAARYVNSFKVLRYVFQLITDNCPYINKVYLFGSDYKIDGVGDTRNNLYFKLLDMIKSHYSEVKSCVCDNVLPKEDDIDLGILPFYSKEFDSAIKDPSLFKSKHIFDFYGLIDKELAESKGIKVFSFMN